MTHHDHYEQRHTGEHEANGAAVPPAINDRDVEDHPCIGAAQAACQSDNVKGAPVSGLGDNLRPRSFIRFPSSSLTAINDGCVMDMRVKFAQQLLTTPYFVEQHTKFGEPRSAVCAALDIADELYKQAEGRALIKPMDQSDLMSAAEIAHIRRSGIAQVIAQMAAQEYAQDTAGRVQRVMTGMPPNHG